ncbi:MAG: transketolase [Chloroflexota bacterium]
MSKDKLESYKALATRIRVHALRMTHQAKSSHIGGCLSVADLLAVLYDRVLKVDPIHPNKADRDRFIMSKGHAAAAVYAVLAESGFFPLDQLRYFYQDGSNLSGHVTYQVPGVEASTGSLGHGLSMGAGMALAGKASVQTFRVFVLLSDGELDEGSTWEAALFAPHHHLGNLIAIVDYNKIQSFGTVSEVLDLEPLAEKWKAFGWSVQEIDGHNFKQIESALLSVPFEHRRPSCIIAHTIKGKGVSFMENQLAWHYKHPNDEELRKALAELGVSG